MAGFTYSSLKTTIQNYVDSSETTFVNTLNTIIEQGEERILKGVWLDNFKKNVTGKATSGTPYLGMPTDFLAPFSLAVLEGDTYHYLNLKQVSFMRAYEPIAGSGTTTYTVTVASGVNTYGSGNKYYLDGINSPTINLTEGQTYRFDQSDSSNLNHPLRFSTTGNGTWGGGTEYTTGVTTVGTPGSAGAYTEITVAEGAPTLHYYCTNHSGMGGQANTPAGPVTGRPKYYAEFDSDTFILAPTPNGNYTFELHYFYRPASLTAAGDSGQTWLSENAPTTLLYACLTEAAIFLKMEPTEIAQYNQRFEDALARLKNTAEGAGTQSQYRYDQVRIPIT